MWQPPGQIELRSHHKRLEESLAIYLQRHGSAQYLNGIATDADIGNAFPFPRCPDMNFAWAPAFYALVNHHLLVTICDAVLDHPTGSAARR
jgi:hypothetical protein